MKPVILAAAFLGCVFSASAQSAATTPSETPSSDLSTANLSRGYGMLGQDYAGAEFGYTHHVDGPPSVLHRYGFIANRPVSPASAGVNLDGMFKYNYTTGADSGLHAWQHDAMIGTRAFLNLANVKPFVEGNVGWAWTNNNFKMKNDSFAYLLGAGAEFQLGQRFALTPYVNYEEMPHFHGHAWTYGTKAAFRVSRTWSGVIGGELDEDHNIEYRVGWNRHF